MGRSGDDTRARIVSAAEELFARDGIESVSFREVMRVAGVRNTVSVQYHFTDRDGVVGAILDKHRPAIEARRHAMLDELEAVGGVGARQLASALVRPWASKLGDPDGGRAFLQVHHELVFRVREGPGITSGSYRRWRTLAGQVLPPIATTLDRAGTASVVASAELARRARSPRRLSERAWVSNLLDVTAAILTAPVSDETTRAVEPAPARSGPVAIV